jgi:hypothetical protein
MELGKGEEKRMTQHQQCGNINICEGKGYNDMY